MTDTIIKNVIIYDGSGAEPHVGDIYMRNGRFTAPFTYDCTRSSAGSKPAGSEHSSDVLIIDGTGLSACPGFIDAHTHTDFCLGRPFNSLSRVSQGITTQIAGQCGKSGVLRDAEMYAEDLTDDLAPVPCPGHDDPSLFRTFKGYRDYVDHLPMVENTAFLVGHGNIRRLVMGYADRKPTDSEMDEMKAILREAMENGAIGLSSGLFYPPGVYADAQELAELCKVVAEYDGIYTTHMRTEGDGVFEAVDEALEVARLSGCKLNISHLKIGGVGNFGRGQELLDKIREARSQGISLAIDQYPYSASCTGMEIIIPPEYFTEGYEALNERLADPEFREELRRRITDPESDFDNTWLGCGGFSNILIADCPVTTDAIGKTVAEYAAETGAEEFDTYFDLMIRNNGNILGVYYDISEDDVRLILQDPEIMVGCDSAAPFEGTSGHPRTFGSFTRVLGHYSRDLGLLPMSTAIYKMSGLPAKIFGMTHKGIIEAGRDADLVLFDHETVIDTADYTSPESLSEGIIKVFISGEIVFEDGKMTDARPGHGLYLGEM